MDNRRVGAIFFSIFLLYTFFRDGEPASPAQILEIGQLVEKEKIQYSVLNTTFAGEWNPLEDKWLNLTGLRHDDGYTWHLLPLVRKRVRDQVEDILVPWKAAGLGDRFLSPEALDQGYDGKNGSHLNEVVPFYQNVTGLVHGKWVRSRVPSARPDPPVNVTAVTPDIRYTTLEYDRNVTGQGGDLSFHWNELSGVELANGTNPVRQIRATMTLQDESSSGDGWEISMYGVHFQHAGSILLTTTSDKFAGIFALPHLVRSNSTFNLTRDLLREGLWHTITFQEKYKDAVWSPWSSTPLNPAVDIAFPTPHCEYVAYLQQHPVAFAAGTAKPLLSSLSTIERELRRPTGLLMGQVPDMVMSATIFSPDCGHVLESQGPPDFPQQDGFHLKGPKQEVWEQRIRRVLQPFAAVVAAQLFLLVRQLRDTSTPSTRSRVSFYTIAIMGLADGFAAMSCLTLGLVNDATSMELMIVAFLSLLSVSFFGMKFMLDIWEVQEPERRRAERERAVRLAAATPAEPMPTPAVIVTAAGADTLPPPVTAPRPVDTGATPIILPSDQNVGAEETATTTQNPAPGTAPNTAVESRAIYSRFVFTLLVIVFVSLSATIWPVWSRTLYTNSMILIYLSLWAPQIRRNIQRNCRKALRWDFVIGQSVLRLIPIAYFYALEDNILHTKIDRYTFYAFVAWVWIQILFLVSQEILGPRFFVPLDWAPPAYDYHPILREDDGENNMSMPIGFTQATTDSIDSPTSERAEPKKKGSRVFDCAICMQDVDVPVVPKGVDAGASSTAGLFTRRQYMVTPCRHIFHTACLEGWMKYRLQCPICREGLPPL